MSDQARIRKLFATDQLDELVWQGNVDNFADGANYVDVVVSSQKPAILQDVRRVGLAYWPDGPVVRGVQTYAQGQSVTFAKVLVKKGGTLALAATGSWIDGPMPVRVDVVPVGEGANVENDRRDQSGKNPLDGLMEGAGVVLALVAVIAVVYVVSKVK